MGKKHKKHSKSSKGGGLEHVNSSDFVEAKLDKNCPLIALDTNVFIDLSHMNDSEDYSYRRGSQARFMETMQKLKKLGESGKVKFVILPGVFKELNKNGMSQREKEFLSKYCVYFQPLDMTEFVQKTVRLARTYLAEGVMNETDAPVGDAIIMAEASLAGINILTNNYKDFEIYNRREFITDSLGDIVPDRHYYEYQESNIPSDVTDFNERKLYTYLDYKQRARAIDIAEINEKNNLVYPNRNGFKIVPMPFTVMDYVGKKGEKSGLMHTEQFDTSVDLSKFLVTEYQLGE